MAGALRKDPAIEQFARMRDNTPQYFKFNRKSGTFLLVVLGLIPAAVGYMSYHTHGQIQLAGVRRGQPLYREWPKSMTAAAEGSEGAAAETAKKEA